MTIDPVLMCVHCAKPTLHLFVERRIRRPISKDEPFDDVVYSCAECGEERRWGNEVRDVAASERIEETILRHAVEVHGLRIERCSVCHGTDHDCPKCDFDGDIMFFENPEPCGPGCPFGDDERVGTC
jgi:hypothetical protein